MRTRITFIVFTALLLCLTLPLVADAQQKAVSGTTSARSASQSKILNNWRQEAARNVEVHTKAAKRWYRRNFIIGIFLVLATVITSAGFLTDFASTRRRKLAVGVISVIAPLLAGLQTFLKPEQQAEKHRTVVVLSRDLVREIDATAVATNSDASATLAAIRNRLKEMEAQAPPPNYWSGLD
jgi:hypothetical protein